MLTEFSKIKVALIFINSNYLTEFLWNGESFQHENVCGGLQMRKRFFGKFIYIILTFEVDYKLIKKAKLT
jgi:hypothetical protein